MGWLVFGTTAGAPPLERFTLLVIGVSGESRYETRHEDWRGRLITALRNQRGFQDDHLVVLAETPGPQTARLDFQRDFHFLFVNSGFLF